MLWSYKTPGIPDELFLRYDDVPITKEEVRVIALSKARLSDGDIVIDVGCGSGSISVEAALQIGKGMVYAIDKDHRAIEVTKENIARFGLTNVRLIHAEAQNVLNDLPSADAIFIGGTGGDAQIIKLAYNKLKSKGRMIIDLILVESIYHTLFTLKDLGVDPDITQVIIAKSRKVSMGTMMLARNPVTIISVEKG